MAEVTLRRRAHLEDPLIPSLSAFLLGRWAERAAERGEGAPLDLSGACIFCSVFARETFGGEIRGNERHFHLRTPEGRIVDLCREAADVRDIASRGDPYLHDRRLMRSRTVREQIESCAPRVSGWIEAWKTQACAA